MQVHNLKKIIGELVGNHNVLSNQRLFIEFFAYNHAKAQTFSQLYYWQQRSKLADGFFAKTFGELAKEVCVPVRTLKRFVAQFEALDLIETKVKKFAGAPTKHYKLNVDLIIQQLSDFVDKRDKRGQPELDDPEEAPAPPPAMEVPDLEPEKTVAEAAPSEDDLQPLSAEEVDPTEGYKTMLKTDREFIETCCMRKKVNAERVFSLIDEFTKDKVILEENTWKKYRDYKRHFFNWLNKQSNGDSKQQGGSKQRRGLHDNGQIISEADASAILADLSREG